MKSVCGYRSVRKIDILVLVLRSGAKTAAIGIGLGAIGVLRHE
jgi:hypothetical protein